MSTPSNKSRIPVEGMLLLGLSTLFIVGLEPFDGKDLLGYTFIWPVICIGLFLLLTAIQVGKMLVQCCTFDTGEPMNMLVISTFLALYMLFITGMYYMGFYVVAPFFLFAMVFWLNSGKSLRKRILTTFVVTAAIIAAVTCIFVYIFNLNLPLGYGSFRTFNENIVYLPYRFM